MFRMPTFAAVVQREGDHYVAQCPELEVASQGTSVNDAVANLKDAVAKFLDTADVEAIVRRASREVRVVLFVVEVP